ncbi:MAG: hypothetical protein DWQ51_07600 [Microcystis wesenbergii TW10]|uniref:Uncharacterized protein n=2 Tax=Microcystis TaxID=1125 RepID=A0A552AAK8_MICAE|nr:MAG: hypothetical protein DWQ51_07600 [Microcystis wesenbergii TW10]TRT82506.1 MAG: hypothetical protein EWV63_19405 [Microcystis aeruginosa Ma_OC_H_19870700_S124]
MAKLIFFPKFPGKIKVKIYLGFAAKSLLVGLGVGSRSSVVSRGSQNNRMTSRTGKRNPLQSPPESARILSPSDRFLNVCFWHFFSQKSAKTVF